VLTGGKAPADAALAKGYYVEPTIVRAQPQDHVCMEEVFGPFVSVSTFKDEAEVIGIANQTPYGLGGGLWTRDLSRAHRVAGHMQAGMVWINSYKRVNPGCREGTAIHPTQKYVFHPRRRTWTAGR
jgi:aldehyde dehydrogenase (NAD+)/betaine-aldehyde dehydrogenase